MVSPNTRRTTQYPRFTGFESEALITHAEQLTALYRNHLQFSLACSRATLDAVNERGYGDEGTLLRGWAFGVDVDWRRWFVRVAQDPHVNYTPDSQLRVAGGLRF